MKSDLNQQRCRNRFAALLGMLATLSGAPALSQVAQRTPIPLEVMIREPSLESVTLSPDGSRLAAITSLDGVERAISVWRTDTLGQAPTRFGMGGGAARSGVRIVSITWVANDRLLVNMTQPVEFGSGAEARGFTGLARLVGVDGRGIVEPLARGGTRSETEIFADKFLTVGLLDQLPDDPRHILMVKSTLDATFVYRVDVYTGAGERLMQIGEDEAVTAIVDAEGRPRAKQFVELRDGSWVVGLRLFDPANNSWSEHEALSVPVREVRSIDPIALDPANEDILIVRDSEGGNFTYLRGYSISRRTFFETLFADTRRDITGVLLGTTGERRTGVVGYVYVDGYDRSAYTEPAHAALQRRLEAQLVGMHVRYSGRNGRYRVVRVENSATPPGYFLLEDDERLIPLGSSNAEINSRTLSETQFVTYRARDGLTIPAFLTLPFGWRPGDAPLPIMVLPHGGPWTNNNSDWGGGDLPVTQYFASRGFAVLQPQFRGSVGYGNQLWRAGDNEWGQKMQDDLDDGLQWVVSQRIGDPDRAMIYGFSYGGYAAMAATVRPNPPWRCAISGAGVSSLQRLGSLWRENRIQRQAQGWTVTGLDPLEHAEQASIPILIYGGDRDQTVPIYQSQRFADALAAAGKPHRFEIIRDMPHGVVGPDQSRQELTLVESFIRDSCDLPY
jgi:dipeptidyl aminopeptidase/acylaminoacyl peptidase